MHEIGITQDIVALACERAGGARIKHLVLEIGKLSAVLPDAVRFCFDICAQDTAADGARLEIIETAGAGRCRKCAAEVVMEAPLSQCRCGSTDLEWLRGDELRIKEMEVV
jgi:hydrogenase nickel incorporation protein HypA/HybF